MSNIGTLIASLERFMDAKAKYDEEIKEYEGCSWDYFGHSVIESLKEAGDELEEELNALIDARIDARKEKQ